MVERVSRDEAKGRVITITEYLNDTTVVFIRSSGWLGISDTRYIVDQDHQCEYAGTSRNFSSKKQITQCKEKRNLQGSKRRIGFRGGKPRAKRSAFVILFVGGLGEEGGVEVNTLLMYAGS